MNTRMTTGLGFGGLGGRRGRRRLLRSNFELIPCKSAVRRLARRGGVKRISSLIPSEVSAVLKAFLERVLKDAISYAEHARRKTVTTFDVVAALRRQHRTLYGFGGHVES